MKRMLHETSDSRQAGEKLVLAPPAPHKGTETGGIAGDQASLLRWLLLIYRIPAEPSSARTAIWRETKRLGALSLQHAVCLFPYTERLQVGCNRLAHRIAESYGGEATLLETTSPDATWQAKIIARFNTARNEEYEEVVDETERYHEEIARERRKGKYTFAELEDEESNLRRLRKYLAQVQVRDTFEASGYKRAATEVERCAEVLETFAQEIYERQENAGDSGMPPE
jgi:uncharacterized protein YdbL (DUF1318 family)